MKRTGLKTCQCGARPAWVPAKDGIKRGRRMAQPERLECAACGNRTAAGASREALAEEWNSAGWCGQGECREASKREEVIREERRTAVGTRCLG